MLVIFDCDGVLVDSEILALRLMAERLTEAGFPIEVEDMLGRFAGFTDEQTIHILEEEFGRGIPDSFLADYSAELDKRLPNVQIIPGAQEVLDLIDAPRCVCSNSETHRLKITLGATGLWDRFRPYIFSAREVGEKRPKPAPDVYLHAAKEMGVAPADTIVIEDSVAGVAGAVKAGMRVIGFVGASHQQPGASEALTDAGAETVVRRLVDAAAVVEAFKGWRDPG
ncbi:HAD family hydrolase [Flaviflagellibacter deserti]|uniref:HAD family hydrolase n=1 Tax=Flaviflagellibacter deserti TaxID=2267266 RepID=A0ABV9Z3L8_9HYPH